MASEPPSPSGQGPLPRAEERTGIRARTGVCHFMLCLLYSFHVAPVPSEP